MEIDFQRAARAIVISFVITFVLLLMTGLEATLPLARILLAPGNWFSGYFFSDFSHDLIGVFAGLGAEWIFVGVLVYFALQIWEYYRELKAFKREHRGLSGGGSADKV